MPPAGPSPHGYAGGLGHTPGYPPPMTDTTGQVAPPGMKPRVTATLWEDEGSMCFQVEAKGICVARRDGTALYTLTHRHIHVKKSEAVLTYYR